MSSTLTSESLARMLHHGAGRLLDNHELLSRLDAATGDGDHGTTMKKVAAAIQEAAAAPAAGIAPLLDAVGWAVLSVDGGSISPLLGSFFLGMAEVAPAEGPAVRAEVAAAFEAGLAKLQAQTPAKPGDKTLLDALVPAVQALRGAEAEATLEQTLAAAAEAAAEGAEATRGMQARFGRARNLGARTVGQVDPGATSVALLFAGMRDGLLASV